MKTYQKDTDKEKNIAWKEEEGEKGVKEAIEEEGGSDVIYGRNIASTTLFRETSVSFVTSPALCYDDGLRCV